jgi:hypothetical protein
MLSSNKANPMSEPIRIRALRELIIKKLPRFPNNRESKQVLEGKSLGCLLIDYTNWAVRYVVPRVRSVSLDVTVRNDPRWLENEVAIASLIRKIEEGVDLTPYLSDQPRTRGFTPAAAIVPDPSDGNSPEAISNKKWADKDLVLNARGFHHLHLVASPSRSNEILFARFDRKSCEIVGIFGHSAFCLSTSKAGLTGERERLFNLFNAQISEGASQDSVSIGTTIATSGHSVVLVTLSANYAKIIEGCDPQLDSPDYVSNLYKQAGLAMPKKPNLQWNLRGLDLGVVDEDGVFFLRKCGLN